jgi:hypothetical protein
MTIRIPTTIGALVNPAFTGGGITHGPNRTGITSRFREGYAYSKGDLNIWLANSGWIESIIGVSDARGQPEDEGTMANYAEQMDAATAVVENSMTKFFASRDRFKGELRNDVSSVGAAANRMHAEMLKLQQSVEAAIRLMNSAEMIAALANAERLAQALGAINALQSQRLTFAVIENKSPA